MKPYKIFSMAMILLLFFSFISIGRYNLDPNSIVAIIAECIFSFIFPSVIFFSGWLISFIRKENNKSLLYYYSKVLLNFILPYFLCMVPYIIYEHGINNVSFYEFLRILFEGNIVKEFTYLRIIIDISIVFPVVEYFIKKNTKVTLIISFALSAIFSLFNLNDYIYTDVFNYLIYLSLGTAFSYYRKEVTAFVKNEFYTIFYNLIWTLILVGITKTKVLSFFNPIVEILYNITIAFLISNACYARRAYFYRNRNYLFKNFIFNPPIVGISIFLLVDIILTVIAKIVDTHILTIPGVFACFAGIVVILVLIYIDKLNKRFERKIMKNRLS